MKNMKIKVETDEHGDSNLDEIVVELGRLGYKRVEVNQVAHYVQTNAKRGIYKVVHRGFAFNYLALTTLAELRSMNIETLKEM